MCLSSTSVKSYLSNQILIEQASVEFLNITSISSIQQAAHSAWHFGLDTTTSCMLKNIEYMKFQYLVVNFGMRVKHKIINILINVL